MSEVTKRHIVVSDIAFDTTGANEIQPCPSSNGGPDWNGQKINASHLPILAASRPNLGNATNVNLALNYLGQSLYNINATVEQTAQTAAEDAVTQVNDTLAQHVSDAQIAQVAAADSAILASELATPATYSTENEFGIVIDIELEVVE